MTMSRKWLNYQHYQPFGRDNCSYLSKGIEVTAATDFLATLTESQCRTRSGRALRAAVRESFTRLRGRQRNVEPWRTCQRDRAYESAPEILANPERAGSEDSCQGFVPDVMVTDNGGGNGCTSLLVPTPAV